MKSLQGQASVADKVYAAAAAAAEAAAAAAIAAVRQHSNCLNNQGCICTCLRKLVSNLRPVDAVSLFQGTSNNSGWDRGDMSL